MAQTDEELLLPPPAVLHVQPLAELEMPINEIDPAAGADHEMPAWQILNRQKDGILSNPRGKLLEGIRLLIQKKPVEAEASFRSLLDNENQDVPAADIFYWLGETRYARGGWVDARSYFESAALPERKGEFSPYAHAALAHMDAREGRLSESAAVLERFLDLFPGHELEAAVLSRLAACRYNLGRPAEASVVLRRLLDNFPQHAAAVDGFYRLGRAHYAGGNFSQAFLNFRFHVDRRGDEPNGPSARYWLAWSRVKSGDVGAAASDFAELAAAAPQHPLSESALYFAARAAAEAGRAGEAADTFERYLRLHPNGDRFEAAILESGLVQFNAGLFAAAADLFNRLAMVTKDRAVMVLARYLEGDAYESARDGDKAEKAWLAAVNVGLAVEAEARALLKLGWRRYKAGDFNGAVTFLRRLLVAHSSSEFKAEATYWLAKSFLSLQNNSQAAFLLKEPAVSPGPRRMSSRLGYGLACFRLERWSEAESVLGDFLMEAKETADRKEAVFARAESLFNLQRLAESQTLYEEFLRMYEEDPRAETALFRIGYIKLRREEFAAALEVLARFRDRFTSSAFRREAVYYLAFANGKLSRYQAAADGYAEAATLGGSPAFRGEALIGLGEALFRMEKFNEAIEAFQAALKAGSEAIPTLVAEDALGGLALAAMKALNDRLFRDSVSRYRELFPQGQRTPQLIYDLADYESRRGNEDAARSLWSDVAGLYPDHAMADNAMLRWGRSLLAAGQASEAAAVLDQASKRFRASDVRAEIFGWLGVAQYRSGDCRLARDAFEAYFARPDGGMVQAEALYADALCRLESDSETALKRLTELTGKFPEHPASVDAAWRAADMQVSKKNYPEALRLLRLVIKNGKDEMPAKAQLSLAKVYQLMGENDRAVIEYLKVTYLFPDESAASLEARLAAALMYIQMGNVADARDLLWRIFRDQADESYRAKAKQLLLLLGENGNPPDVP